MEKIYLTIEIEERRMRFVEYQCERLQTKIWTPKSVINRKVEELIKRQVKYSHSLRVILLHRVLDLPDQSSDLIAGKGSSGGSLFMLRF